MHVQTLPRPPITFGLAGLLPQAICLALVLQDGPARWIALAAACFYAALILSFLGGLWWMAAILSGLRSGWYYAVAVQPSLFGLAALLPWCLGWSWPGPGPAHWWIVHWPSRCNGRPDGFSFEWSWQQG